MHQIKSLLVFLVIFLQSVHAQDHVLTNELIWNQTFVQQSLESIHPLKSQSAYTVIKIDEVNQQSKIVLYDYATKTELAVLVDSSRSAKIPFFTAYSFSADEQKILLESNVEPIYRRSTRAEYWVYDRQTKQVNYLFGGKVQQARFSPDGSKVAFVYQRNLFFKDLAQNSIEQLTFDGSQHIINGLTDWVYEEEFGFVRAFDWNADGTCVMMVLPAQKKRCFRGRSSTKDSSSNWFCFNTFLKKYSGPFLLFPPVKMSVSIKGYWIKIPNKSLSSTLSIPMSEASTFCR
ncbi:MAG: DPP IV N-terminal domain-containing protein [Flavobacteriaceae bacterium]